VNTVQLISATIYIFDNYVLNALEMFMRITRGKLKLGNFLCQKHVQTQM